MVVTEDAHDAGFCERRRDMVEAHLPDPWVVAIDGGGPVRWAAGGPGVVSRYLKTARREVLLLLSGTGNGRTGGWCLRDTSSGHRTRIVVPDRPGGLFADAVTGAADTTAEIRIGERLSSFLLVADREVAVLRRADANVVVRSPATIASLVAVFERRWRGARPLSPASGEVISDLEKRIIERLAAGLTDAAVASELEISSRTIQRHVRRVMDLVGARSRLELGIDLARRGLI